MVTNHSSFDKLTRMAEQEVAAVWSKMPPDILLLAKRVTIHYESIPDESLLADGFEEDLLGLFDGTSYGEELADSQPMPPQIFLYLGNLYDFAEEDEGLYREEVRRTYLHELGHYLGWDEEDLAARDLD